VPQNDGLNLSFQKDVNVVVKAFDSVKILTGWVLLNDRTNLSFVKAINVFGKKNGQKYW
jgi:hypothetical protein